MNHLSRGVAIVVLCCFVAWGCFAMDWPDAGAESNFWVEAREGWWSDVLILSDGSGPTAFLTALAPDALNWAFYEFPSALMAQGTRRVAASALEYQESEELTPENLEGWAFASSLAYNVHDEPIYYAQWGGSYFMDPHSDPWASLVLGSIEQALVGADGVSQDNIGVPPFVKGQGGFSPTEKAQFRAFLTDCLGEAQVNALEIDVASLDIAEYIREHDYLAGSREALEDPVFRAFVAYQYLSNLEIWQGMLAELSSGLDKIIHGNQYGVWSPWDSNPYSVLLSQLHQVIEIECVSFVNNVPRSVRDSLLYKIGLASGKQQKPVWIRGIVYDWARGTSHLLPNYLRLDAASAYANGAVRTVEYGQGTPDGHVEIPEESAESLLQYCDWLSDHRFLFDGRRSAANVALVYSVPTMMWHYFPATGHWNGDQNASLSGMSGVLEREHVPYDVVIFGHPALWSDEALVEQLARYDLLILPDVECLSAFQIDALETFVDKGGRVLCTGSLGGYDENREPRDPSWIDAFVADPGVVRLTGTPANGYYRNAILQEGYADFERMAIAYPLADFLGDDRWITTDAPESVTVNVFDTERDLLVLHFLNLDLNLESDTLTPAGPFEVTVHLPERLREGVVPVALFPDDGTSQSLVATQTGDRLTMTLPGISTHSVLCLGDLTEVAADALAACEAALVSNPWAKRDADLGADVLEVRNRLNEGDGLEALQRCGALEDTIASRGPEIVFDFSHRQQSALTQDDALTINPEHPDWHLLEDLAAHVTHTVYERPVTAAGLATADVLVLASHELAFTPDEVGAVEAFVRGGGGLLFLGNGGPPSATSAITGLFGLEFLPHSSLFAADHLWDIVSFDVFDVADHPVTAGVEAIRLNYAAAMTVDDHWSVLAATAEAVWQEANDDEVPSPGELTGPLPVVACRTYGDGRVLAVCDDAPFRAWGCPSLVYNAIHWLADDL